MLSRAASRHRPGLRNDFIDALARIGHLSAEPFLAHVASTSPAPVERMRALDALDALATRAALSDLYPIRDDDPYAAVRARAERLIAAIVERYPVEAVAGDLSPIDLDDIAGALSLAGAKEGDLELYELGRRAVLEASAEPYSKPQDETGAIDVVSPQDAVLAVHTLHPPPRTLPVTYHLDRIARGANGEGWMVWALCCASMAAGLAAWSLSGLGPVLVMASCATALAWTLHTWGALSEERDVLIRGVPTVAEVKLVFDSEIQLDGLTLDGTMRTFTYHDDTQRKPGDIEGALAVDERIVLFRDLDGVAVSSHGDLVIARTRPVSLAMVIGYAMLLVAALFILI